MQFFNEVKQLFFESSTTKLGKHVINQFIEKSDLKCTNADIIKDFEQTQYIFTKNAEFWGMVGINNTIYIDYECFKIKNYLSKNSKAKLLGLLWHE